MTLANSSGSRCIWGGLGIILFICFMPITALSQSTREKLATVPPDPISYTHYSIFPATAQQLAEAMDIPPGDIIFAALGTSSPLGVGVSDSPLGKLFPRKGNTFAVLSTGLATTAAAPNNSGSTGTTLDGLNNEEGNDLVQLTLELKVPKGATCLNFDFAFYSEEFPEYVGSIFNDAFTAEYGGTDLRIINHQVVAPLNLHSIQQAM